MQQTTGVPSLDFPRTHTNSKYLQNNQHPSIHMHVPSNQNHKDPALIHLCRSSCCRGPWVAYCMPHSLGRCVRRCCLVCSLSRLPLRTRAWHCSTERCSSSLVLSPACHVSLRRRGESRPCAGAALGCAGTPRAPRGQGTIPSKNLRANRPKNKTRN